MSQNSQTERANADVAVSDRDLLGDPMRPYRDPRGRKRFKSTNELREHIAVCAAAGMEHKEIADAIGCCDKTLRNRFFSELTQGKSVKRAEAIAKLWELGMAGNVPALKAFLALADKASVIPPAARPAREAKAEKLGKKEQAVVEAQTAHQDSSWGALLEPPDASVH